jgi:hypothetical protein
MRTVDRRRNPILISLSILTIGCRSERTADPIVAAQPQNEAQPSEYRDVAAFLNAEFASGFANRDQNITYASADADLNQDGVSEVVVYAEGDNLCGTGGCDLFILRRRGERLSKVAQVSITWPPVRVLNSATSGWHDIGVWVQGGGILPGYEARLRYSAGSYPFNPSVPPAERVSPGEPGRVLISASTPRIRLR